MRVLQVTDLRAAYARVVLDVYSEGRTISPRGLVTKELDNVALVFPSPAAATFPTGIGRAASPAILAAELMQILAGVSDLKQLDSASHGVFSRFSDDGARLSGAYGPRTYLGLRRAVDLLDRDSSTRQATVSLWNTFELDTKDLPCTVSWSFTIRDNTLRMTTFMRSNDVISGLTYDAPFMARIQSAVAWALGIPAGTYTHIAQSLHIYITDVEKMTQIRAPEDEATDPPPLFDTLPSLDDTASGNWHELTKWALQATRAARDDLPSEFAWYARKLEPHVGNPWLCNICRYFVRDHDSHACF